MRQLFILRSAVHAARSIAGLAPKKTWNGSWRPFLQDSATAWLNSIPAQSYAALPGRHLGVAARASRVGGRVVAVAVSLVDLAVFVMDHVLGLSRFSHLAAFGLGFLLSGGRVTSNPSRSRRGLDISLIRARRLSAGTGMARGVRVVPTMPTCLPNGNCGPSILFTGCC
jgi:hypothetical protein